MKAFANPFRPGAGHKPPYLAGRKAEQADFKKLLGQQVITDNFVLTGLRGVGKTVLLEELKAVAVSKGWLWVGTDLSETASISEDNLAQRIITDLAVVTSAIKVGQEIRQTAGFGHDPETLAVTLNYDVLTSVYKASPGLVIDKLKAVFALVSGALKPEASQGIIFAYDEAQNLSDHAAKEQYPLSLLLDLFQSIQRQDIPFMLVLAGLPTLFPKLVDARTYAERMFRVVFLKQLSETETHEAITKPIEETDCPVKFHNQATQLIFQYSGGYPYFVQFICREAYDTWLQKQSDGRKPTVPVQEIIRKLDTDFFVGRWAKVTDRQQELLMVIADLENDEREFTVQEIAERSAETSDRPFGRSHINQLLTSLISQGLIYRDRHGKYLFAVPLMGSFIKRTMSSRW